MQQLKNIIFDLGNVLFDIDFQRVKISFEALGIEHFEQHYSQLRASELFIQLECGQITPDTFYQTIRQQTGKKISDEEIKQAWNSILLQFRTDSIDYLQKLKSRYRLFLLSNTNSIHLEEINRLLFSQTGIRNLSSLFEKAYYSHEVGMRKPAISIYEHVIKDAAILPSESIFIDDTIINIKPAQDAGLYAHLFLPEEKIENLTYFRID